MQSREKVLFEEVLLLPDSRSTNAAVEMISSMHQDVSVDIEVWQAKLKALRRLIDDAKLMLPRDDHSKASGTRGSTFSQDLVQSVDATELHCLMDRITKSPYLKSTLHSLVGNESALLSSKEVASCIEQVGAVNHSHAIHELRSIKFNFEF